MAVSGLNKTYRIMFFCLLLTTVGQYSYASSTSDSLLINNYKKKIENISNNDLDSTIYYLNQLKRLSLSKEDQVKLYIDIGNAFFFKGEMYMAVNSYMNLKELGIIYDDVLITSAGDISIAGVYLRQEEYLKAIEILKNAEINLNNHITSIPQEKDKKLGYLTTIYINISNANAKLSNYVEAEKYLLKAIDLSINRGDKVNEAIAYSNKAELQKKKGYLKDAIVYENKALEIRKGLNSKIDVTRSLNNLGEIYYEAEYIDSALFYLNKGYSNSADLGVSYDIYISSKLLSKIYAQKGDFTNAYKYLTISEEKHLNIIKTSNSSAINDLNLKYEMELLKKEEKVHLNRLYIALLILVIAALIVALLYLVQKRKVKQKHIENMLLKAEKSEVESTLEAKNKKLVTNIMLQISRNELIISIAEQLQDFAKDLSPKQRTHLARIIKSLKTGRDKDVLKEFELTFHDVHTEFYNRLDKEFSLTTAERRMAAFLKLNLTSKEISAITGQSVRTIDVTRYRLRKKLNINNTDTNLSSFIAKL